MIPDQSAAQLGATVFISDDVPRKEEQELMEALEELGFAGSAKEMPTVRSADMVEAIAVLMIPATAFLNALGASVATDAYDKFKRGLARVFRRHADSGDAGTGAGVGAGAGQPIVLKDVQTGLQILIGSDLPNEAYSALTSLHLEEFRVGPLHWDQMLRRWRSIADEALRASERFTVADAVVATDD